MTDEAEVRVEQQIKKMEADERRQMSQLAELRARMQGMRDALALMRGETVTPVKQASSKSGSRVPDPARSPSWSFVLDLLKEAPPQGYNIDFIIETAKEFGHEIQRPTLRSILSNAVKDGILIRVSVGHYRLAENDEPPSAPTEDGSSNSNEGAGTPPEQSSSPKTPTVSASSTIRQELLSGTAALVVPQAAAERS